MEHNKAASRSAHVVMTPDVSADDGCDVDDCDGSLRPRAGSNRFKTFLRKFMPSKSGSTDSLSRSADAATLRYEVETVGVSTVETVGDGHEFTGGLGREHNLKTKVGYLKAHGSPTGHRKRTVSEASEFPRPSQGPFVGGKSEEISSRHDANCTHTSERRKARHQSGYKNGPSSSTNGGTTAECVRDSSPSRGTLGSRVGPQEFIAMYRARAYSEPQRLNDARMKAIARARAARLNTYSVETKGTMTPSVNLTKSGGIGGAVSPLVSPRGSREIAEDEPHMVVWMDGQNGTQVFRLPKINMDDGGLEDISSPSGPVSLTSVSESSNKKIQRSVYIRLLEACECYYLMPSSSRIVVFAIGLSARAALYALIDNGIRAAPVWDVEKRTVVHMLTVTDFIRVVHRYLDDCPSEIDNLEFLTLREFFEMARLHPCSSVAPRLSPHSSKIPSCLSASLVSVTPNKSLMDVTRTLFQTAVRRLPIIDARSGDVLHILTKTAILRFLYCVCSPSSGCLQEPQPAYMNHQIGMLGVGTYRDLVTARMDTPLDEVLRLLVRRRISSVPIVDADGRLIGQYSKASAIHLAVEKIYTILSDLTIGEILGQTANFPTPWEDRCNDPVTCHRNDTLSQVLEKLVISRSDSLIVIDNDERVEGVVSQSDVLYFLAFEKCGNKEARRKFSENTFL